MSKHKMGTLVNAFGPLSDETLVVMRGWRWQTAVERLFAIPTANGVVAFGRRDLAKAVGSRAYDADTLALYVEEWVACGIVYADIEVRDGRFKRLNITTRDLTDLPADFAVVTSGKPVDHKALGHVLQGFRQLYNAKTKDNWTASAKEIGLAKRLLKRKHGNPSELLRVIRRFFNMPLEQMPDDLSFTSFYYMYDKIAGAQEQDARFEQARAVGMKEAAARAVPPTAEDDAEYARESAMIRERNARDREMRERGAARLRGDD